MSRMKMRRVVCQDLDATVKSQFISLPLLVLCDDVIR